MAGRHCSRNRKLREHIFKYKLETESKLEVGQAHILSKPPPQWCAVSSKALSPTPAPKQCHKLGTKCSNAKIHKDRFYSDYYRQVHGWMSG